MAGSKARGKAKDRPGGALAMPWPLASRTNRRNCKLLPKPAGTVVVLWQLSQQTSQGEQAPGTC